MKNTFDKNKHNINEVIKKLRDSYTVAIDHGYGYVKATDTENEISFPNVISAYVAPKVNQDMVQEYVVTIKNRNFEETYKVGNFAKVGQITKEWNSQQAIDSRNINVVIGTSLFLLTEKDTSKYVVGEDGKYHINLALGLPIDAYNDQRKELENKVKNLNIEVTINEKKKEFVISSIQVFQQGISAFMYLSYNKNCVLRNKEHIIELLKNSEIKFPNNSENKDIDFQEIAEDMIDFGVGIGDIGYRTVDGAKELNGRIQDDESAFSREKGLHNYHLKAFENIKQQLGDIGYSLLECEDALNETNGMIKNGNAKHDIKPYFEAEYKQLADDLKNELNQRWKRLNNLGVIFLCGGGAKKVLDYTDFPVVTIVPENPIYANAIGYYIRAQKTIDKYLEENINVNEIKENIEEDQE